VRPSGRLLCGGLQSVPHCGRVAKQHGVERIQAAAHRNVVACEPDDVDRINRFLGGTSQVIRAQQDQQARGQYLRPAVCPRRSTRPTAATPAPERGRDDWRPGNVSRAHALPERQQGDSMVNAELNARVIGRPKYPPPPRSGNAFAAAVFAAIPGLLLLITLFWVYAR
jgi:hypothetical protein